MELDFVKNDQWEEFVEYSNQGTIFHSEVILSSFNCDYEYGIVKKKGNPVAGMAFPKTSNLVVNPYQAYNGILFHPDLDNKKMVAKIEGKYQVLEFIANELLSKYNQINFNTIDYQNTFDLRPFHWINYHDKSLPTYTSQVFYTSIVETNSPIVQSSLRKGRASSLNKSKKFNLETNLSENVDDMMKIYLETFERQEVKLDENTLNMASTQFKSLIKSKKAIMTATSFEGELASMSIFGIDKKRSYYLFGANKTEYRNKETGTANIAWSIEKLNSMGIDTIDMVGVNSPQRGSFKLSFGGNLIPYYQVIKKEKR